MMIEQKLRYMHANPVSSAGVLLMMLSNMSIPALRSMYEVKLERHHSRHIKSLVILIGEAQGPLRETLRRFN